MNIGQSRTINADRTVGPRHHYATVSFIQPIILIFNFLIQNIDISGRRYLSSFMSLSICGSNICSPQYLCPCVLSPLFPASSFDHCLSPFVAEGGLPLYISPLVVKGWLQYIFPLCRGVRNPPVLDW